MKNEAEEKAIAFVKELQREELTNSNHSGFYILPQLLGVAHKSFMVGYNESMRWRDPKEELPENVGLYLCKCEKKLGFYFDIVFFNKVWRSDNVIGWRPIE